MRCVDDHVRGSSGGSERGSGDGYLASLFAGDRDDQRRFKRTPGICGCPLFRLSRAADAGIAPWHPLDERQVARRGDPSERFDVRLESAVDECLDPGDGSVLPLRFLAGDRLKVGDVEGGESR